MAGTFLAELFVEVVAFDYQQAKIAWNAFDLYGKGRHKAGLNFGDCIVYALAKSREEPLLFKGADFRLTDIVLA